MLTYELKKQTGIPLYEALYRCIRSDILKGALKSGDKLPSKRALAVNLEVSKITVETAYAQLLSEGFIRSRERSGYFVEAVQRMPETAPLAADPQSQQSQQRWQLDLTANSGAGFPFSVWSKLQREVMVELGPQLLQPMHNQGLPALRQAIARQLAQFRGMQVSPDQILVGAGTDFLYNLLIQLLGRDKLYAVEEPGYDKIRRIYAAAGARCVSAGMDSRGIRADTLDCAQVLHLSPSHHFPTGLITPMDRRTALLSWAAAGDDRYIIEDDYDSEFRFDARPMPTLQAMDKAQRVIYMNTFSKSLTPSIRISYMVLPPALMAQFQGRLGFYSCTVPSFEQYTLERFLSRGYFEKHINRMRKAYKSLRNQVIAVLKECRHASRLTILEQNAGLHFLVKVDTDLSDRALTDLFAQRGIRIRSLSSYYHSAVPDSDLHCLVVNYSGLSRDQLPQLKDLLNAL